MKKIILLGAMIFGLNHASANTDIVIAELEGKDRSGSACTLVVKKMNSWEGQYVIWLNGAYNFRVEVKDNVEGRVLNLNDAKSPYNEVELSYKDGVLRQVSVDDSDSSFLRKFIVTEAISIETNKDFSEVISASGLEVIEQNSGTSTEKALTCEF